LTRGRAVWLSLADPFPRQPPETALWITLICSDFGPCEVEKLNGSRNEAAAGASEEEQLSCQMVATRKLDADQDLV